MKHETVAIGDYSLAVYSLNTVVVGSGAAGLNAADRLCALGQTDVAIVTENMMSGTSRNTGSDKQTYYKLTLAGSENDSVREMAETLFEGGAMHGDIALVEAALSSECFHRLASIGVPFPHNTFGEYVGYKTDHDPRQRATSAGPYTSRFMTECLEKEVQRKGVTVMGGYQVIGILTENGGDSATGLLTLNLNGLNDPDSRYALFNCRNIVYAVGGPAGMYGASVYPGSQRGSSGIAFEAGVRGKNLTESQFGIASLPFRWNLSGTYQQVVPRYISTDVDGGDEREFLADWISDSGKLLDAIFLKGYQWPFDPRKIHGSSIIDVLVYHETVIKGRRVFLDYRKNPSALMTNGNPDFSRLGEEGRNYLEHSGALFGTPVERLKTMNAPAYDLFREHGIDLEDELLEIAVSNQHNNGGLEGNIWWESNLKHFFPVGEVNGSHGVYRPGGSALNAGQVGSFRAAQFIAKRYGKTPPEAKDFVKRNRTQIEKKLSLGKAFTQSVGSSDTTGEILSEIHGRMDRAAGVIRSYNDVESAILAAKDALYNLNRNMTLKSINGLPDAFTVYDLLLSQYVYLNAIADYIEQGGQSRGSYIIHDKDGDIPLDGLPDDFRFSLEDDSLSGRVQLLSYIDGNCEGEWEDVRPVPESGGWFETVWKDFLDDKIIK